LDSPQGGGGSTPPPRKGVRPRMSQTQIQVVYETPTQEKKNVVLWVSRHSPLPLQIETLEQKLGAIKVYQVSGTVPSAEYVVEVAKQLSARYIIPVLPLSFIARLVEFSKANGFTVLWAEMEQVKVLPYEPRPNVDYNTENETVVVAAGAHEERTFKIMRFKRFNVIKAVRLEMEPW